jgi:hypothetical protein
LDGLKVSVVGFWYPCLKSTKLKEILIIIIRVFSFSLTKKNTIKCINLMSDLIKKKCGKNYLMKRKRKKSGRSISNYCVVIFSLLVISMSTSEIDSFVRNKICYNC